MCIIVYNSDDEVIYKGDADDFLFCNDNDLELEIVLNNMERTGKQVVKVLGYLIRWCAYED